MFRLLGLKVDWSSPVHLDQARERGRSNPWLRAFALVPALMGTLGACTDLRVMSPAEVAGANTSSKKIYRDVNLVRAHPRLLKRTGPVLTAKGKSFVDRGNCAVEGDCVHYLADGVWLDEYVGINVQHFEEGDYLLVTHYGTIPIGARPIPSPNGKRFFVGSHDDRQWSPYQGASVWEWEPHPRRLRVVDTDLVTFEEFIGWQGNSCVNFRGARGYNVRYEATKTFWLAESEGDWRLFENQPASCR